jgi:hypothetical protein
LPFEEALLLFAAVEEEEDSLLCHYYLWRPVFCYLLAPPLPCSLIEFPFVPPQLETFEK